MTRRNYLGADSPVAIMQPGVKSTRSSRFKATLTMPARLFLICYSFSLKGRSDLYNTVHISELSVTH